MDVQLILHFDEVDVWWAEFSGVPGFTASAESLPALRAVLEECLPDVAQDLGEPLNVVSEILADPDPDLSPEPVGVTVLQPQAEPVPALRGTRVRIPVPA